MYISRFFLDLRSAYQAELDDLSADSEGKDVLRKRLAEKRKELGFLVKMIEISPEMVAVVLHQAFQFTHTRVLDDVLCCDAENLPDWEQVSDALAIAPWASETVRTILNEPMGAWFMTLAAALEYMRTRPVSAAERRQLAAAEGASDDEQEGLHDLDEDREYRHDDNHTEDHDEEEAEARAREEAGNDWLAEQGFDRKD